MGINKHGDGGFVAAFPRVKPFHLREREMTLAACLGRAVSRGTVRAALRSRRGYSKVVR